MKYMLSLKMDNNKCTAYMNVLKVENVIFVGCWMTITSVLPLTIIASIYVAAAIKLNRNTAVEAANNRTLLIRLRKNKKVVRMFVVVVITFFVLTTPYTINYFMQICLGSELDTKVKEKWNYGLFVISASNSCINPIIYNKMHEEVNRQIKRLCKSIKGKFIGSQ